MGYSLLLQEAQMPPCWGTAGSAFTPQLSLMASGKFLCLGNASMAETAQRSKMLHMQPTALGRSENLGIIECYECVPGVLSPCPKFCSNLNTGVVLSLHSHSSFPVLQPWGDPCQFHALLGVFMNNLPYLYTVRLIFTAGAGAQPRSLEMLKATKG